MSRTRLWIVLALVSVLAGGLIAAGCGGDDDDEEEGAVPQSVSVGSDIPFPPFEQGKAPDYDGFDIELVREIGDRAGFEVTVEDTSFDTIFRDLAQGKFDLVASATTITPERERTVDFSDPYFFADQSLLGTKDGDVRSVDDLAGATVGVQQGTTGQIYAEDETDAENVRGFPEFADATTALQAGQVDAVIMDLPAAEDAVDAQPELEIVEELVTREEYGMPVAEDNTALLDAVNEALQEVKDDGTYAEIYQKWFKEEPPEELLDATHEPE